MPPTQFAPLSKLVLDPPVHVIVADRATAGAPASMAPIIKARPETLRRRPVAGRDGKLVSCMFFPPKVEM
jgi:hypothetical protein